jgi:hypothetical protein
MRLAPNVVRAEGIFETDSAATIKSLLTPPTTEQFSIDKPDVRWFVDKPDREAVAFYILAVGTRPMPNVANESHDNGASE